MKKCNTEIMKELKAVQAEKEEMIIESRIKRVAKYYEGEEEVKCEFDFKAFQEKLNELEEKEFKLKALLSFSNATTKLIGKEDYTIGEGLIKLAQLNNKLKTLVEFKVSKQIEKVVKHATFEGDKDRVFVTEYFYNPLEIDEMIKDLKKEISALQIAIDRTNLMNIIEY